MVTDDDIITVVFPVPVPPIVLDERKNILKTDKLSMDVGAKMSHIMTLSPGWSGRSSILSATTGGDKLTCRGRIAGTDFAGGGYLLRTVTFVALTRAFWIGLGTIIPAGVKLGLFDGALVFSVGVR